MAGLNVARQPDAVTVGTEEMPLSLARHDGEWRRHSVTVVVQDSADGLRIDVASPRCPLRAIRLRWQGETPAGLRYLGDHWERGYGDLEWRGLVPERQMPWYFLATDTHTTWGVGVKTGTRAFAWWQVDSQGITLCLDVSNGTMGVQLGERVLHAADVVMQKTEGDKSPFAAACDFCRRLCDRPRLPAQPVYGGNNWYYAYGVSSHQEILGDTQRVVDLAPASANRPWMVIDAGWSLNAATYGGPWHVGNARFPDMPGLAEQMKARGARPGIWVRPLLTADCSATKWRSEPGRFQRHGQFRYQGMFLDASRPEVLDLVAADIRRLVGWGYELIKHDFTTYDIFGMWGFEMAPAMSPDGFGGSSPGVRWGFADPGRTTAEIILDLYRAIRTAAGDALVIGCNTINHLSAGLFELQRTGDDTSGLEWERTRKMGVNTLAFRMPQHGRFFAVDADCVGLTRQVPWEVNRQWLDVLARSGTPLFVSFAPDAANAQTDAAVRAAFAIAAEPRPVAEPLDWLETTCPTRWRCADGEQEYAWAAPDSSIVEATQ